MHSFFGLPSVGETPALKISPASVGSNDPEVRVPSEADFGKHCLIHFNPFGIFLRATTFKFVVSCTPHPRTKLSQGVTNHVPTGEDPMAAGSSVGVLGV